MISVLLWGAENWALTKSIEDRLEVFHHRSIRRILKIKMSRVKEERLSNEKVRGMFRKIRSVKEIIKHWKLTFLQHVVSEGKIPSTTLTAWMEKKRPKGRPRFTTRTTTLELLKSILPNHVTPDGDIQSWTHFARDKALWEKLVKGEIRPEEFNFDGTNQEHQSSLQTPPQSPPPSSPPSPNQSSSTPPFPPHQDQEDKERIMNNPTTEHLESQLTHLAEKSQQRIDA